MTFPENFIIKNFSKNVINFFIKTGYTKKNLFCHVVSKQQKLYKGAMVQPV